MGNFPSRDARAERECLRMATGKSAARRPRLPSRAACVMMRRGREFNSMSDSGEEKPADWLPRLTLAGAAARGFVYLVIGGIGIARNRLHCAPDGGFSRRLHAHRGGPAGPGAARPGRGRAGGVWDRPRARGFSYSARRAAENWLEQSVGLIHALVDGVLAAVALRIAFRSPLPRAAAPRNGQPGSSPSRSVEDCSD